MKLSVIIPTYNEAQTIMRTISQIFDKRDSHIDEVVVVDGGSTDQTTAKAREARATVVESPRKGRAAQMNAGAEQSTGEVLYFLHADSTPPADFVASINQALAEGNEAGCFQLAFDDDHWLLRLYAWFSRFDVDLFRFGDQSLFIRQETFRKMGGFREDHMVMEDQEIVRRIKKDYSFTILEDVVTTSARKYRKVGILKLQLIFILILSLYYMGLGQERLVAIYQELVQ